MQETVFLYGVLIPGSPFAKCMAPIERSESKGTNTIAHPTHRQCQKKIQTSLAEKFNIPTHSEFF
jgi:DNA-binding cell septation regulator SpoVG